MMMMMMMMTRSPAVAESWAQTPLLRFIVQLVMEGLHFLSDFLLVYIYVVTFTANKDA